MGAAPAEQGNGGLRDSARIFLVLVPRPSFALFFQILCNIPLNYGCLQQQAFLEELGR